MFTITEHILELHRLCRLLNFDPMFQPALQKSLTRHSSSFAPFSNSPLIQALIDTPAQIIKIDSTSSCRELGRKKSTGNFVQQTLTRTAVRELAAPIADIATITRLCPE
jgi:hypothetical protein